MKIEIVVKGEPDVKPFIKTFEYDPSDEFIFFESVKIVKDRLSKNLSLNINETLALFASCVMVSLKEEKNIIEIQKQILGLLLPHQVMIGVPESIRELVFSVTIDSEHKQVFTVVTPIKINQYSLCEEGSIL